MESKRIMLERLARFLDQGAEKLGIVGGSPRAIMAGHAALGALRAIWQSGGGRPAGTGGVYECPVEFRDNVDAFMRAGCSQAEALREAAAELGTRCGAGSDRKKLENLRRKYKRAAALGLTNCDRIGCPNCDP
ncbi:MAG: hypothetical protein AB7O04_12980 [Hyphomonadaceae bacterium]